MSTSPTPDQIGGVLFGSAYGDALAAPTEFIRSPAQIRQSFAPSGPTDLHAGRVTDDTQMMLAVARAVLDAPELTPAALEMTLRAEFVAWLHDPENNRAPGLTCLTACRNLQRGGAWQAATVTAEQGLRGEHARSAGGLIADDLTRAGAAQLQAALTHGHPTALAAADLTAQAIWLLSSGTAPQQLTPALTAYAQAQREVYHQGWLGDLWQHYGAASPQHYISQGWDECLGVLARLDAALTSGIPDDADPCDFTGEGWIAEEALATGLLCFLLTPSDPVEVLRRAAVTRGDSDSLACLAGAFAGAHLGLSAFPAGWRTHIEYAEELQRLAAGFEGDHQMSQEQTSQNNPMRVSWIENRQAAALWPGRLGLTIAPGKKGKSPAGPTVHDRDLETDFAALKSEQVQVDVLVNLMEEDEGLRYGMGEYDAVAQQSGLTVRRYPIVDVDVPSDRATFAALVDELYADLQAGKTVVVHCLGGLGRSGTLAACLLIRAGLDAQAAIDLTRRCRPGAIQGDQPEFVRQYAKPQRG